MADRSGMASSTGSLRVGNRTKPYVFFEQKCVSASMWGTVLVRRVPLMLGFAHCQRCAGLFFCVAGFAVPLQFVIEGCCFHVLDGCKRRKYQEEWFPRKGESPWRRNTFPWRRTVAQERMVVRRGVCHVSSFKAVSRKGCEEQEVSRANQIKRKWHHQKRMSTERNEKVKKTFRQTAGTRRSCQEK